MDGEVIISTKLDTKSFEKQIAEVEYELAQIDYELSHAKELNLDQRAINEYTKKAEQLNNKLIDLRKRQEDLNKNNFFGRIGDSIEGVIKKVTRWGLAIFGVRSAYMAVRRAASTISQYDDQVAVDLSYIQYALAMSLEPLIRTIIDLAYKLLNVVNSISMAVFNYNLFLNASVDKFNKINGTAKDIKKTLTGFDEMNILGETSAGGTTLPTVDLSNAHNEEEGKKFKSFWEDIIQFWEEDWEEAFDNITGNWNSFFQGIGYLGKGFYDTFKGIIQSVKGWWQMLVGLFQGDTEKLNNGWKTFINGIKSMVVGLIEGIIGLALMLFGTLKGIFLDITIGIYNSVIRPVGDWFGRLWDGIKNGGVSAWNGVKNTFSSAVSFFSNIINQILGFFRNLGIKAGEVVSSAFKSVINAVLRTIESILNTPINTINRLIDKLKDVPVVKNFLPGKLNTFNLPRLAKGGIVNLPGRGVPIGGAIAGEAGREAVLPLQDSQVLQEIADAIGSRITINANITNTMNGRVISRELQRVQNDSNFAYNR